MTNEEKALELMPTTSGYYEIMDALLNMAQWKDKQFAEQKQQLIDNACDWIANYLMDSGYPDDWMRDSQTIPSGEQLFRKAMKGNDNE